MTYRNPPRRSRYHARMVRRDKNAAWALTAQARLKAFEAKQKEEKGDE